MLAVGLGTKLQYVYGTNQIASVQKNAFSFSTIFQYSAGAKLSGTSGCSLSTQTAMVEAAAALISSVTGGQTKNM